MIGGRGDGHGSRRSPAHPIGGRRGSVHAITSPATRFLPAVLLLAVLLAAWRGIVAAYDIPTIILPTPEEVAAALVATYPTLLEDAAVTGVTAGIGLLGGGAIGLLLAFAMTSSRATARLFLPYIVALRIAPVIAIAPLLFLWFGRGIPARALLVTTVTVFPVTIATLDGLRSTPDRYLDLARSIGASPTDVFVRVRVPAAAPSVIAGFKIAATLSVIGAVVAEFVTLNAGLGYRVFDSAAYLRTAETYAALVVLSLLGLAFYLLPVAVERVLWD